MFWGIFYNMLSYQEKIEREERAERLKKARQNAGFRGPQAVADQIGLNVNSYKAHESGRNGFNPTQAQEYATAFGVSAQWLLFGEGDMTAAPTNLSSAFDEMRIHIREVARDIVTASDGKIPYDPDDFAAAFLELIEYRIAEPEIGEGDQQNVVKFQMRRLVR